LVPAEPPLDTSWFPLGHGACPLVSFGTQGEAPCLIRDTGTGTLSHSGHRDRHLVLQFHCENGALADFTFYFYASAMGFDVAFGDGESEACATGACLAVIPGP
jgi:hypothetical protein